VKLYFAHNHWSWAWDW